MTNIKLLKCPVCKSTRLRIFLVNRFKKKHYYIIQCRECDWYQKFNHSHVGDIHIYETDEEMARWFTNKDYQKKWLNDANYREKMIRRKKRNKRCQRK